MTSTKIVRPATATTDIAKPIAKQAGRYHFGTYGQARYGNTEGVVGIARPTNTTTDIARPA